MKKVRLVALERLPYGGKNLKKGAEFKASKADAQLLVRIGKAARVKPAKAKKAPEITPPQTNGEGTVESGEAETIATTQESAPATAPRRRTSRSRVAQVTQTK